MLHIRQPVRGEKGGGAKRLRDEGDCEDAQKRRLRRNFPVGDGLVPAPARALHHRPRVEHQHLPDGAPDGGVDSAGVLRGAQLPSVLSCGSRPPAPAHCASDKGNVRRGLTGAGENARGLSHSAAQNRRIQDRRGARRLAAHKFLHSRRKEHERHQGVSPADFGVSQEHGKVFPEEGNAGAHFAYFARKDGAGESAERIFCKCIS